MKKYRILEEAYGDGGIIKVYIVESYVWWWPVWEQISRQPTKAAAISFINERKKRKVKSESKIVHEE